MKLLLLSGVLVTACTRGIDEGFIASVVVVLLVPNAFPLYALANEDDKRRLLLNGNVLLAGAKFNKGFIGGLDFDKNSFWNDEDGLCSSKRIPKE